MKFFKAIIAAVFILSTAATASAQFKIGPRVGINVNSLHFSTDTFDKDNRTGFNAGLEAEFTIPGIGFGFDLSAMYVKRNSQYMEKIDGSAQTKLHSDYIEIPLNVKYKIGLPLVSKIITPYVFTGPSFAFLTSKEIIDDVKSKKCDIAWNFGFGVELIKHLQIGASYGIGMTKAMQTIKVTDQNAGIEGKNRYWTVTAAWLF